MSSDPGDPDDESAALRARLDRLKGDLKGRAAPRPLRGNARPPNDRARPAPRCRLACGPAASLSRPSLSAWGLAGFSTGRSTPILRF